MIPVRFGKLDHCPLCATAPQFRKPCQTPLNQHTLPLSQSQVMHAYVDAMDFTDMEFDLSIRQFLNGFRCVSGKRSTFVVITCLTYGCRACSHDAEQPQLSRSAIKRYKL